MAMSKVPGGLWIPTPIPWGTATPAFGNILLDASAEKAAFIIQVPKTGTLQRFEFLTGTAVQTPANGLKCSFQDVDLATGDPDGTIDQFRPSVSSGTDVWVVPGVITSDGTDSGTKRSVTRGERLACVVEFQSFLAGDSINIRVVNLDANVFMGNPPYPDQFTAAWSKLSEGLVMALRYDDGTYETILGACYPFEQIGSDAFNIDSGGGDEIGLAFSFESPVRVGGYYMRADLDAVADLVLYDKDGVTALDTMSLDPDVRTTAGSQYHIVRSPTDRLLDANDVYRVILKPTTTTNVNLSNFSTNGADLLNTMEGGSKWYYTLRVNNGTWADSLSQRPFMGIIVTGIDHDISGGSGGPGWEGDP